MDDHLNSFEKILLNLQEGGSAAARFGRAARDVGDTLHAVVALVEAYGGKLGWTGADVTALTQLIIQREQFHLLRELREEAEDALED